MKVVGSAGASGRAKVDVYWCAEPGKKWTRVLRQGTPYCCPTLPWAAEHAR